MGPKQHPETASGILIGSLFACHAAAVVVDSYTASEWQRHPNCVTWTQGLFPPSMHDTHPTYHATCHVFSMSSFAGELLQLSSSGGFMLGAANQAELGQGKGREEEGGGGGGAVWFGVTAHMVCWYVADV